MNDRSHQPALSRIGIITGSGPEAGVDLWTKVLRANRQLLGARETCVQAEVRR